MMGEIPTRRADRSFRILTPILGLVVLLAGVGAGWAGATLVHNRRATPTPEIRTVVITATFAPATVTPTATSTPPPAPTIPPPTPTIPATPTPYIVVGADGVNVREGPDVETTKLGYLDPGAQAPLLGCEEEWCKITYQGEPAWVYEELVTVQPATTSPTATETVMPITPAGPAGGPVLAPVPPELAAWAEQVVVLINVERERQGLPLYTYSGLLEQAARLHAEDCAARGECDHLGSDGSTVTQRAQRVGYVAQTVTEVIVYSSSPEAAVAWWLDETPPDDPHRSALLSTWTTELGVGVAPGDGTTYFVVVFGRPAE